MYYSYKIKDNVLGLQSKTKTAFNTISATLIGLTMAVIVPVSASAAGSTTVYDAIPNSLPPNVPSLGFEATSTSEFGDYVHLAGTDRNLKNVKVTMSDWALFSDYATDSRYSSNNKTWQHQVTVNIYSNELTAEGVPTHVLATKSETVTIPWRPAADSSCTDSTQWKADDGKCYNGKAFNATFDLSDSKVTLPNDVIVGVAYNTADYGANPLRVAGPYNSLNVGIPTGQQATVGRDDNADNTFWNTSFAGFYSDSNAVGGTFREDTKWAPNGTVALQINATSQNDTEQCKNGGWMRITTKTFKNQGDCVSYFATNGKH